jgi:hypothetical protein
MSKHLIPQRQVIRKSFVPHRKENHQTIFPKDSCTKQKSWFIILCIAAISAPVPHGLLLRISYIHIQYCVRTGSGPFCQNPSFHHQIWIRFYKSFADKLNLFSTILWNKFVMQMLHIFSIKSYAPAEVEQILFAGILYLVGSGSRAVHLQR